MLNLLYLDLLKNSKSLLAFSGGVDSSALFHLLAINNIDFDIAHVNYNTRSTSDTEAKNALALAQKYNKQCYIHSCHLEASNFEHNARMVRHNFFASVMQQHPYDYLLTAHQLNDRLEWMMMQLCRGAGLPEMLGISSYDQKGDITILRPLLEWDRDAIQKYLDDNSINYFCDESNSDEKYTRNRFRHQFSNPLMNQYSDAIRRSFRFLQGDREALIEHIDFTHIDNFYYAPTASSERSTVFAIDKLLKTLGFIINAHERHELLTKKVLIVGRRYVIIMDEKWTFIAPYIDNIILEKKFKEESRVLKIHPKLRGFLASNSTAFGEIKALLTAPLTPLQYD